MLLNYIWVGFFLVGFIVALIRIIGYYFRDFFAEYLNIIFDRADLEVFTAIVNSTFDMAKTSVTIAIYLIGVMTLWLGIMKIGEKAGAINSLSKLVAPFFKKIFPDIPDNHPAIGSILMNFCANMLGLDNAATPLGLKAMKDLQKLNPKKDTASNPQIMFIVLNASALTIVPISIMAIRAASGAKDPTDVFVPLLLATYFSTLAGLIAVSIIQRINLLNKIVLAYIGGITILIALVIWYLNNLEQPRVEVISRLAGNFILFLFIIMFIWLGVRKKINIYESFIEGAKEGIGVAIKIIPYLVAMLVAIGIFRASGAMDFIISGLDKFFSLFGINTDFIPALPTAFMKPLSGSGARGLMVEAMKTYGPDSFVGRLASTFQGSTETTFYTLAVYFGAVNIRKIRYSVTCGLIADLAGIVAAIFIAYLFFH
jgi:spore maturation protein SpmA